MSSRESSSTDQDMTIYINGSEYRPLKKIAGRDQLLGMAKLDSNDCEIFLLGEDGRKMLVENDEGIQMQAGMRFLARRKSSR